VVYTWRGALEGEREMALRLAGEAARLNRTDPTVLTVLGATLAVVGHLDEAARHIHAALALDPHSHWAWQRCGWLKTYAGDFTTAVAYFRRALTLNPHAPQIFNTYVGLGVAEFDAGNYDQAAGWIRLALQALPTALWAHRILAAAEAHAGHGGEARRSVAALRRAQPDLSIGRIVSTFPANPGFLHRLAEGLESGGMPA
jgi:adenylate cyclase